MPIVQSPAGTRYTIDAEIVERLYVLQWVVQEKLRLQRGSLTGISDTNFVRFLDFLRTGVLSPVTWSDVIELQRLDGYFDHWEFTDALALQAAELVSNDPSRLSDLSNRLTYAIKIN